MSEWTEIAIQSGLIDIIDYRGKTPPKSDNGITLISAANIKNGDLDFSKQSFISHEDYEKWKTRGITEPGDVLITTEAPAGEVALLPSDKIYQISRRVMALRADEKLLHNKFLYFLLQHPSIKANLLSASRGSTVPRILKTDVTEYKILIPDYEYQVKLVSVLGYIKEKIDLLQRQNQTLEALAQTLFRQWFIEEAEDEWEEYQVRDFVTHIKQSVKPKNKPTETFFHYSLPAFDDGKIPVQELGSEIRSNKYKVAPYSVLVSKLNPRFPRIWGIYFEPESNSICSTEFQVLQPNSREYFGFIYYLMNSDEAIAELELAASGTSGSHQRVRPDDILNITFTLSNKDKAKEFSQLVEPGMQKKVHNRLQIRTLEKLRDTLLPKLMSGKARVRF